MRGAWLGFVLSIGCSSAIRAGAAQLSLSQPGHSLSLSVSGDRIFGPDVEVSRYGDEYRGRSEVARVDVRVAGRKIVGVVDGRPTELDVIPLSSGFVMRGLFAGAPTHLTVTPDRVAGRVGRCSYDLRRVEQSPALLRGRTEGTCRILASAELVVPPDVHTYDVIGQAMIFALLLFA